MNHGESDHPEDDDEGVEVFASGSWPQVSPLATLWGTNAFLGERPDWATAAAFLTKTMERHRSASDAFAKALLTDAPIGELNSATADLEESIVSLGLARSMLSAEPDSLPLVQPGGDESAGDDLEWHIGFAEGHEYADDILPPLFELPIAIPFGISLLDTDDTTVRVRDARVYSGGLLVTVDVAVRRTVEMSPHDRMHLETVLLDVLDEDGPDEEQALSTLVSASAYATARACVAQWEYWIALGEAGVDDIQLRNPLGHGVEFWHVAIDRVRIDEARSRVIDLSGESKE